MFFFFPIPAGVYLYLVVSNIIQTFQTWLIARMPEPEFGSQEEAEIVVANDSPKSGGNGSAIIKPNKGAKASNGRRNGTASGAGTNQAKKKNKKKK